MHPQKVGVLANPVSTNYAQVARGVGELVQAGYRVDYRETLPEDPTGFSTYPELNRVNDVVVVASGDGTIQKLTRSIIAHEVEAKPIVVFGTGNANDLAHTLHQNNRSIANIIQSGSPEDIQPLVVTIDTPDAEPTSQTALSYFGLGVSAAIIHRINNARGEWTRKHPLIRHSLDTLLTWQEMATTPRFTARIGNQAPQPKYIGIDFLQGTHYIRTFHEDTNILDSDMVKIMPLTPAELSLASLYRMADGRFGASQSVHASTIADIAGKNGHVKAHFDGEVQQIENGSSIKLRAAGQAIPFVVTPQARLRIDA